MYSFLRGRLEKEEAKRYLAFTPYQNIKKFLEETAVGNIFQKKSVNYIILKIIQRRSVKPGIQG